MFIKKLRDDIDYDKNIISLGLDILIEIPQLSGLG